MTTPGEPRRPSASRYTCGCLRFDGQDVCGRHGTAPAEAAPATLSATDAPAAPARVTPASATPAFAPPGSESSATPARRTGPRHAAPSDDEPVAAAFQAPIDPADLSTPTVHARHHHAAPADDYAPADDAVPADDAAPAYALAPGYGVGPTTPSTRPLALVAALAAIVVLTVVAATVWAARSPQRTDGSPAATLGTASTGFPASPTPHATPTPSVDRPATRGVVFRFEAGHLAARFATRPTTRSIPISIGRLRVNVHAATETRSHQVAESMDLSPAVASGETRDFLRGLVAGLTNSAHLTPVHERSVSFRGHDAREAVCHSASGVSFTVLVVLYSPKRAYVLFAPSGSPYAAFRSSFVALR